MVLEIRYDKGKSNYSEELLLYYFWQIFSIKRSQDMKVGEGVLPRVWCRVPETSYFEQQYVVLELVIDPYIHVDNSTIT